MKRQCSAMT